MRRNDGSASPEYAAISCQVNSSGAGTSTMSDARRSRDEALRVAHCWPASCSHGTTPPWTTPTAFRGTHQTGTGSNCPWKVANPIHELDGASIRCIFVRNSRRMNADAGQVRNTGPSPKMKKRQDLSNTVPVSAAAVRLRRRRTGSFFEVSRYPTCGHVRFSRDWFNTASRDLGGTRCDLSDAFRRAADFIVVGIAQVHTSVRALHAS